MLRRGVRHDSVSDCWLCNVQVLQPLMPSSLFRVYSFLLRSANNVLGGVSFVMAAR